MTAQQLRDVQQAKPFRPFTMHMADGRSFQVPHPEFLLVAPSGRTAVFYDEKDSLNILDVMLMTRIETTSAPSPRN